MLQRRRQLAAKGDDAVLVTLAVHLELALDGIDSVVLEPDELAQADTRFIEQHDDEPVAHLREVLLVDVGIEHRVDGVRAHKLGQGLCQLCQFHIPT